MRACGIATPLPSPVEPKRSLSCSALKIVSAPIFGVFIANILLMFSIIRFLLDAVLLQSILVASTSRAAISIFYFRNQPAFCFISTPAAW